MLPLHLVLTVPLAEFECDAAGRRVFFLNCGLKNNNPKMPQARVEPQASAAGNAGYEVLQGTRAKVDATFHGCCTSLSKVMTAETAAKLGAHVEGPDL